MIKTYKGVVYPWECDHMGHLNVQFYAAKFDEATWQLFGAIGMVSEYLRDNNRGMVAVEQKTKYKKEIIAGDLIEIESSILEIKHKSIRFLHIMKKSYTNEIIAETELTGIHINIIERKSCEFDKDINKAAEKLTQPKSQAVC
jgi:acyl-CoA thioester hydrolase